MKPRLTVMMQRILLIEDEAALRKTPPSDKKITQRRDRAGFPLPLRKNVQEKKTADKSPADLLPQSPANLVSACLRG
jgi:hypothetical protein